MVSCCKAFETADDGSCASVRMMLVFETFVSARVQETCARIGETAVAAESNGWCRHAR